jgi:hypothetical protein
MNCQLDSLLPERPGSIWNILQSRHEPVQKRIIMNLSNKPLSLPNLYKKFPKTYGSGSVPQHCTGTGGAIPALVAQCVKGLLPR